MHIGSYESKSQYDGYKDRDIWGPCCLNCTFRNQATKPCWSCTTRAEKNTPKKRD